MSEMIKPVKYLVCVDKYQESRVALRLATARASARGGHVDLVHVIPPNDFQSLPGVAERMRQERRSEAETLLAQVAGEVHAACGQLPSITLREGKIGDEIVAATAEDYDAAMLVLGVAAEGAGRGRLVAWLASQLGTKLLIPLLLVPGNLTDQQLATLI